MLDLDGRDLDTPRLRMLVEDVLQLLIQPIALGEEVVELRLTQHAPERRLRELERRVLIVLDFHNRPARIDHPIVQNRAHLDRHVVPRDDVLRRYFEGDRPEADAHHTVDRHEHKDHAGAFGVRQQLP